MDLELTGKVAIVGGASKGLGRACAQVLGEEGASVAICSRTREDLDRAAKEIQDSTGAEVMGFAGDHAPPSEDSRLGPRAQVTTVSPKKGCRLSAVGCQLSAVSCQREKRGTSSCR